MVLAAGRGERLRPITDTLPKPLVAVAGRPLIVYHLDALARAGIQDVVINLSWLGERIKEALGDGRDHGVRIRYSEEGPGALETGGGIFKALPLLGPEPFLVVNGDVWTDIDLGSVALEDTGGAGAASIEAAALARTDVANAGVAKAGVAKAGAAKAGAAKAGAANADAGKSGGTVDARIVLVPNPPHHARGDYGLDGDLVVTRDVDRFTYSGVGIYRPEFFAGCTPGKFPLAPLLNRAIAAGRLRGTLHRGQWCDVGSPARLADLDQRIRSRQALGPP